MADLKHKLTPIEASELEGALEFLRRYHPDLWDKMDELEIARILEISRILFVDRPELLAATTNPRCIPIQ
jgi:hypothetical protein